MQKNSNVLIFLLLIKRSMKMLGAVAAPNIFVGILGIICLKSLYFVQVTTSFVLNSRAS